jgi:hypothetical protein
LDDIYIYINIVKRVGIIQNRIYSKINFNKLSKITLTQDAS